MQTFEVIIPELEDQSYIEASTPRRAIYQRLLDLDECDFDEIETLDVTVVDELGMKSVFHVAPSRVFRLQKVR